MPIRPELRHHYTGPAWKAVRERILARADNKCEACGAPNRVVVTRICGWWRSPADHLWRHADVDGEIIDWHLPAAAEAFERPATGEARAVEIVLTIAHLNHTPGDNRDANLAAYCQWCHFAHDQALHVANSRATRQARKDAARPLLWLPSSSSPIAEEEKERTHTP